jgi:hypothetical protein
MIFDFIFASLIIEVAFIVFVSVVLTVFTETDHPILATIFVIGLLIAIQFGSSVHPIQWMISNWFKCIEYFFTYVAVGTSWGVLKWILFINEAKRVYNEIITNMSVNYYSRFKTKKEYYDAIYYTNDYGNNYGTNKECRPQILKNKGRFMPWMIWWPFNCVWTIINDPVTRLFNWIYAQLGGFLQKLSNRVFSDIKAPNDLE